MLAAAGAKTPAAQLDGVDLLPPSAAFRLEVSRPRAEAVQIRWTIAEGYYLYRERFRFEATPAKVLQPVTLPAGIRKEDPFFGKTEIYRHGVAFELPLEMSASGIDRISLRIVSQGCADIGICFPPETREVRLGIGETVIAEAGNAFAPAAVEKKAADLLSPSVLESYLPPDSPRSP